METVKNALVLFTKAPIPGLTKTRLTKQRGGILTPQEAADLYRATLLDVADVAFRALQNCSRQPGVKSDCQPACYDFVVSAASETDSTQLKRIFEQSVPSAPPISYIVDRGNNFDEHFNDAYRQLFAQGYHSVIAIGGDLPTLRPYHIEAAFQWLDYLEGAGKGAAVLASCQDCGVSLVGVTDDTALDFGGVFYNQDGVSALDKIVSLCALSEIPIALLDTIADIDTTGDLAHAITLMQTMRYASQFQTELETPTRTLEWVQRHGIVVTTPPNPNHDPREMVDAVH